MADQLIPTLLMVQDPRLRRLFALVGRALADDDVSSTDNADGLRDSLLDLAPEFLPPDELGGTDDVAPWDGEWNDEWNKMIRETIRVTQEPPQGVRATWVWDDSPPEDFGQLYMPVCRTCGRGPLADADIESGECGDEWCVNPTEQVRAERDRERERADAASELLSLIVEADAKCWWGRVAEAIRVARSWLLDSDGDSEPGR